MYSKGRPFGKRTDTLGKIVFFEHCAYGKYTRAKFGMVDYIHSVCGALFLLSSIKNILMKQKMFHLKYTQESRNKKQNNKFYPSNH